MIKNINYKSKSAKNLALLEKYKDIDFCYFPKQRLTDIFLKKAGYQVIFNDLYYNRIQICSFYNKKEFYAKYLYSLKIDFFRKTKNHLYYDNCSFISSDNILYVIDYKFLYLIGNIKDKIKNLKVKHSAYKKILKEKKIKVKYILLLDSFYKEDSNKEILDWLEKNHFKYFFDKLPLIEMNFPIPENMMDEKDRKSF